FTVPAWRPAPRWRSPGGIAGGAGPPALRSDATTTIATAAVAVRRATAAQTRGGQAERPAGAGEREAPEQRAEQGQDGVRTERAAEDPSRTPRRCRARASPRTTR